MNSIFSISSGLVALIFAKQLSPLFALHSPTLFYILGPGLILFGLSAWRESGKKGKLSSIKIITISDFLWVLGTIALILVGLPTNGALLLAGVAIVVLWFAVHQSYALRYSATDNR